MELLDMDYVGMGMEVLPMTAGTTMSSAASATEVAAVMVTATATTSEDEGDLRRGPWTEEEDSLLVDYIAKHGEGRWNSLARCAGLRRTGKSCRLRWLNYLRPDVRRGNITAEEQLLILELHSRWGNRWSKIAQHLPGRTDNEIKNYWRTRVQKHARQLRCDVNSAQFRDVVRLVWMPRLVERMQAAAADSTSCSATAAGGVEEVTATTGRAMICSSLAASAAGSGAATRRYCGYVDVDVAPEGSAEGHRRRRRRRVGHASISEPAGRVVAPTMSPDTSSTLRSSASTVPSSHGTHFTPWAGAAAASMTNVDSTVVQCAGGDQGQPMGDGHVTNGGDELSGSWSELLAATGLPDYEFGDFDDNLWSLEDVYLQQHC